MRNLLFIVNPNSGKKKPEQLTELIRKGLGNKIAYEIVVWEDKSNFDPIKTLIHSGKYSDAIAVGGDGTVNEVARAVAGSQVTLGIVPAGSGNGLARSLGLSMNTEVALKQIFLGKTARIDMGTVNSIPFFCTSGVGFDAHIGNLFANSLKRGLQSYVKITLRELISYKSQNYSLLINNQTITKRAFLITVGNAGQYGNDFYISPEASMQDGKFHVAVLKPFGLIGIFGLMLKILSKKAHESRYIETYQASELTIRRSGNGAIHFDGEPIQQGEEILFKCHPASLKVIVGNADLLEIPGILT